MPINAPFLLNALSDNAGDIQMVRAFLKEQYPTLQADTWWLFGTDGCHLCETVQKELTLIKKSYAISPIQIVDIIDLNESLLTAMATHIPILITPKAVLNYPFGMMDMIGLLDR